MVFNESSFASLCKCPSLSRDVLLERRDRDRNGGGVITIVLGNLASLFSPLARSPSAEILWFLYCSWLGPVVSASGYRPPHYGEIASSTFFSAVWTALSSLAVGAVVIEHVTLHRAAQAGFVFLAESRPKVRRCRIGARCTGVVTSFAIPPGGPIWCLPSCKSRCRQSFCLVLQIRSLC